MVEKVGSEASSGTSAGRRGLRGLGGFPHRLPMLSTRRAERSVPLKAWSMAGPDHLWNSDMYSTRQAQFHTRVN